MGQKCNPISNRLGIVRGWDSNWFGGNNFGDNILEDSKIRKYLNTRLANASVSKQCQLPVRERSRLLSASLQGTA